MSLLLLSSVTLAQNVSYSPLATGASFNAKTIDVNRAVGSTAGAADASGGATYSIPVALPPGTNGIVPGLSVSYNSMGGNGVMGMGWGLSGLSIISRVARTVYHDGAAGPVELSANDRFSMEGNRLIGTNGTTYGANDATYATESESFATIRSFTTANVTGTGWFSVVTKDGTVMEYGNTADSRFMDQAGTTVLYWRLNKIQYLDGNYIDYVYDNTDRDSRISQIRYTGNAQANLAPYNTIDFAYAIRATGPGITPAFSDIRTTYEAGSSTVSKYLLDNITVKAEGTVIKKYQFVYGHNTINSYLNSITEFGSDNAPLNPTIFKYGDTPVETTNVNTTIPGGTSIQTISGDYDGDGKREILAAHKSTTNQNIPYFDSFTVYKANPFGTGYLQTASQNLPTGYTIVDKYQIPNSKTFLPSDFTRDGLDDILTLNISNNGTESKLENVTIYKSTNGGTSFVPEVRTVQPNYYRIPANNRFFYSGDFDGDGISEYITILGSVSGNYEPFLCGRNPNVGSCGGITISGTTNFPTNTWTTATDIRTLDFNGDGKTDLMLIGDNSTEIFTFEGSTASRLYSGSFPNAYANKPLYIGDFNGDGKTDLIQASFDFSSVIKAISTGNDFNQSLLPLVRPWPSSPPVVNQNDNLIVGDYNGDGKSDFYYRWTRIIEYENSTGYDVRTLSGTGLYYSQGDSFSYKQLGPIYDQTNPKSSSTVTYIVDSPLDFNGDGKTDLVSLSGSTLSYTLFNKDGTDNLLHKVSNGFNHVTEWTYLSLTEGFPFYTRTTTGNYPLNTIQPALFAVAELNMQNGIGGISRIQYGYGNAQFHRAGKGFLGFTSMSANNRATGMLTVSTNEFNTQFYTPAPKQTSTYLTTSTTTTLLNQATLTNNWVDLGNKRFWYRVDATNTDNTFESRTASTSNLYDNYGNVTQSITITNNGLETTQTNTNYGAFGTPIPAKPTLSTTQKTRTGQPPYSVSTSFDYNTLGQITRKTDFEGQAKSVTTNYAYNTLGNVTITTVSPTDMTARVSSATYDPKGRFALTSTNVLGQMASATYEARWGKPLTTTGIDGIQTTYLYDAWGRTTSTTQQAGTALAYTIGQSWTWDLASITNGLYYNQVTHPGKPDVKTWYDLLGREVQKQTEGFGGQWLTQTQTYDLRGNVATATQPYLPGETVLTTATTYDDYNRVATISVTGMGTTVMGYSYSPSGNLTTTATNPANQVSSKVTDASGQTVSAIDNGGTLSYTYNSQGNLLSVQNGAAVLASHLYDAYGRQTQLTDQNAGTTAYEYDALGQLTRQTNANGKIHQLLYDPMGRVSTRTGPEGTTTTLYTPSGAGINQIQQISGFAGNTTNYTYDTYGRLSTSAETIDGFPYTTSYDYNTYGDVTKKTYPSGFATNHLYDSNGYLTFIRNGDNSVTLFAAGSQNGLGQPLTYGLGNGKTSTNTYEYGMPKRYLTPGVQDLNLTWTYSTGNLQKRVDNSHATSLIEEFTYDALNRLRSSALVKPTGEYLTYLNYDFSPNGNITAKADVGTYSYLASRPNAVSAVTNVNSVIPALQQLISYTPFLQPQTISENGYELTYTYGADYERIKGVLSLSGVTQNTRYYTGPGYEKNLSSNATNEIHYIDSPAGLIAIVVRQNGSDTYHYVYSDHLGSILTVTDASGSVEVEQNFDAWGRRRNPTNWTYIALPARPDWLYRGYTGHEMFDPFVLINMNGRIYDPVVGRVLSPDNYVQELLTI